MKTILAAMAVTVLVAAPAARAEVSQEEFDAVRQMLQDALNRISELEAQQQSAEQAPAADAAPVAGTGEAAVDAGVAEQVEANTAAIASMSWAERIRIQGDFRYRYENADIEGPVVNSDAPPDNVVFADGTRNRNRIRARAAIIADLSDDVEVGLGFASGGDDPVSTNQTLGGGGSTKSINLDQAYFDWTGIENTSIRGGKFKRTLKVVGSSGLQWDSDWRPEGFDVEWDNGTFFAQGLGTYLEGDSNKGTEFAYLLQTGAQAEVAGLQLLGGVGYTEIDAAGRECFFTTDDFGQCFGNETDAGGNYLYDFEVYNVFGSVGFDVGGMPVTVFGDFIKNDAADEFDSGYLVGAQVGKVKKQGSWHVKAFFEELQANATLGVLANSNFGGGGTNGEGWVIEARYGLTDQISTQFRYWSVESNSDNIAVVNNGNGYDFDLAQLDFMFKYK